MKINGTALICTLLVLGLFEVCNELIHSFNWSRLGSTGWAVEAGSTRGQCPADRVLYPCKCHHNERITCTESITYSLGHIFKAISRSALPPGYYHASSASFPLYNEFVLSNPFINELEDNQFHLIRFEKITLSDMKSLTRIKSNAFNRTANEVISFAIKGENKLGIQFINQLFDALSTLTNAREMHLELDHLRIIPNYAFRDVVTPAEPMTAEHRHVPRFRLERLRIVSRSLLQVSSYAFYELISLRYIKIHSSEGLQRISAHAFDIAQPSSHALILDLRSNQLTTSSFEMDSFQRVNRPVHLQLTHNNLTTLQQEVFERFLNVDQQNLIELKDNPLECNCSMFWILKERQVFINQVHSAICDEFADIWSLDESAFRKCSQNMDYMPRLIFRNSAIVFRVHHLVFLPLLLQRLL